MGGIFSAPSPPVMPEPTVGPDPEIEAAQEREAMLERRRRGRAGMVLTSDRGLLRPSTDTSRKKNLLGE